MTVQSISDTLGVNPPAAPSTLAATLQAGPVIRLTWKDNSNNESGFTLQRSTDGVNFNVGISLPANTVSYNDTVTAGAANVTYTYRVVAVNFVGPSLPSNTASVIVPAMPLAPSNLRAVNGPNNNNSRSVILTWTDNSNNETGFTIQRATNSSFTGNSVTNTSVGANVTTFTVTGLSRNTGYYFRILANNGTIIATGWVNATPFPILTLP
jgi:hypothetical protein